MHPNHDSPASWPGRGSYLVERAIKIYVISANLVSMARHMLGRLLIWLSNAYFARITSLVASTSCLVHATFLDTVIARPLSDPLLHLV